jgi:hypothetical protein
LRDRPRRFLLVSVGTIFRTDTRHVARLVTRLVVNYFASAARPGASARRVARHVARRRLLRLRRASRCLGSSRRSSSTTLPTPRVRMPRHVARHVARLVVYYFTYAARLGASARHAARRRLLRVRHASGCLSTSRSSSHGSSSTTSTMPRVRVPRHVAQLVTRLVALFVVNFTYAVCLGASARRLARCRLLRLHRASGCLGTSRGSSRGSSSTTPCVTTSSCGHTRSTSATPCVTTTCLVATLALLQVRRAPPRRRLPVASRRPFISTSFPN